MDEPLASLDSARKQEILPYLERMHANFDIPIIYVSHSLDEVARLSDHILLLHKGQVVAQGDMTEIFSRVDLPINFGEDTGVILTGQVKQQDSQWHLSRIDVNGGDVWVRDAGDAIGQEVRVRILARDVSLAEIPHQDTSILNRLQVEIAEIVDDRDEAMCLVRLKFSSNFIIARITRRSLAHMQLRPGKVLWAQIKSVAIVR
jgi:molybdate transport system ATP-binding protein